MTSAALFDPLVGRVPDLVEKVKRISSNKRCVPADQTAVGFVFDPISRFLDDD